MEESSQQIFNFIFPNQNNLLSKFTSNDINQLIKLLNKYSLEYRQKLGFNKENTFGVEIEFQKRRIKSYIKPNDIYMEIRQLTGQNNWDVGFDGSLLIRGLEASSPILKDTQLTWQRLESVCSYLSKIGYINELCGGHIHIGTHVIGNNLQAWENFIKLWIVYEDIILRFVCGEYLILRSKINDWATPISRLMHDSYNCCLEKYNGNFNNSFLNYFFHLLKNKYQAINFNYIRDFEKIKLKNTIEFRCPNGTLNPIIWQNNINLLLHILTCVKKNTFNAELLNSKFNAINLEELKNPNQYKKIDFDLMLEFCDLVFDNNLDKIYFLKQYLKNLQTGNKRYKKTTAFSKKITKH